MIRRIHVAAVRVGEITLGPSEAHHARDVLRLASGTMVELFDDAGLVAEARLVTCDLTGVMARVDRIDATRRPPFAWTIAAAVPKGDRADWMVEKLSELGTFAFVPLATARGVVLPAGKNKRERWIRIGTEASKQSRRVGVMRIEELTAFESAVSQACGASGSPISTKSSANRLPFDGNSGGNRSSSPRQTASGDETWLSDENDASIAPTSSESVGWYLSTSPGATPIDIAIDRVGARSHLTLFIGPEGGWTDAEIAHFDTARLTPVALTATILRVETAAVLAAGIIAAMLSPKLLRRGESSVESA